MKKILILGAVLFATTFALINVASAVSLPPGPAIFETSLVSRISPTDTSMSLVSNSLRGSQSLSGYNCFTVDEGRSDSEYICGSVSGTAVTALERGLSFLTGTTTITALQASHRAGADVKVTDFPLIQRLRNAAFGSESFPNTLLFDSVAKYTTAPVFTTGSNQLASVLYAENYANAVIAGGAPTSTSIVGGKVLLATQIQMASSTDLGASAPLVLQAKYATSSNDVVGLHVVVTQNSGKINWNQIDLSTAFTVSGLMTISTGGIINNASSTIAATSTATGNTIGYKPQFNYNASTTITGFTTPQPVYIASTTGAVLLSDADAIDAEKFDGFAVTNAVNGGLVVVQTAGVVSGFTGLTAGRDYYVQNSVGTLGTGPGSAEIYVGTAISTTQIAIQTRNWQYLGSQSLTTSADTVISQPLARFAVIDSNVTSTGCQQEVSVTLAKVGATAMSNGDLGGSTGGANACNASYTWTSTSSIRVSVQAGGSPAQSGTAYYYR